MKNKAVAALFWPFMSNVFWHIQEEKWESDYEDYYTQAVEKAARCYAISATDAYFEAIGKYYESKSEE